MFALLAASPFVCLAGGLLLIALGTEDADLRLFGKVIVCLATPAAGIMTALLTAMVLA